MVIYIKKTRGIRLRVQVNNIIDKAKEIKFIKLSEQNRFCNL